MRGDTLVLLALLTRALKPCSQSLSLGKAERQNEHISEDRAVKVRACKCATNLILTCEGCFVEECQSTHMMILFVKTLDTMQRQLSVSKYREIWLCELLNRQVLVEHHTLEPFQIIQGMHKVFHQSSSNCYVYLLFFKSMDSCCFYLIGFVHVHTNDKLSDTVRANALYIMHELNVKNHTRGGNCVVWFFRILMSTEEQMNMTNKLWIRTGPEFMSANFTQKDILNEPNVLELPVFLPAVKVSEAAVKALISTFKLHTDSCSMQLFFISGVSTTMGCKCVPSLHRSLCINSLMRSISNCTYTGHNCAEFHQWRQKECKTKDCSRSNALICKDMDSKKENVSVQWQICTQELSRGPLHKWIMRVLLTAVSLFFIARTAVLTYVSYKQRYSSVHRVRNSNLSFLLLFTISWCSLGPFTVTGQSTGCICKLQHTAFGITFVLCISCVLGKTIVVLMAFRATLPGSNVIKQRFSVPAFTLTQILVFLLCFSMHSPLFKSLNYCQEKMILKCVLHLAISFCYMVILAVLSFTLTCLLSNMPFTVANYSLLNIRAVLYVTTRISLTHIFRSQRYRDTAGLV